MQADAAPTAASRSQPAPRAVPISALIAAAAALFTAASMPLLWRALSVPDAAGQIVGTGTLVALCVSVFALNAILLGLVLNRWTVRVLLPLLLLVNAGAVYFAWSYGVVIDTSMMRNVVVTDLREAGEYLVPRLWATLALLGVLPALVVLRLPLRRDDLRRSIYRRALGLLALACVLLTTVFVSYDGLSSLMRGRKHVRYLVAPANVLVSTARALSEDRRRGQRISISESVSRAPHAPQSRPHVLILVVGETVRGQNWGLSGYARQTTPELARRSVVNFPNVTACGSSTEVSLPCMFSVQGRHEYDSGAIANSESVLHLLARAGVEVAWRDNQTGCKGVCSGLAFESFRDARDPAFCNADGCRDEILLKGLEARLRAVRSDTVIVLHQLGNHGPAYFRRYPPELRRFTPDCRTAELSRCSREQIVNAYDNAVLATDRLLARTIDMLATVTRIDSAMIYVSDHGESLGEKGLYLHGLPYPIAPDVQLRVPMVMWLSDGMQASRGTDLQCLRRRASQPADHDNLFHTLVGMMEVRAEPYQASHDLLAGCARPTDRLAARPNPGTPPQAGPRREWPAAAIPLALQSTLSPPNPPAAPRIQDTRP